MSEVITVCLVALIAFVIGCTTRTVGPGYANTLKAEAAKVYSAKQVGSEWVETEEELGIRDPPMRHWEK